MKKQTVGLATQCPAPPQFPEVFWQNCPPEQLLSSLHSGPVGFWAAATRTSARSNVSKRDIRWRHRPFIDHLREKSGSGRSPRFAGEIRFGAHCNQPLYATQRRPELQDGPLPTSTSAGSRGSTPRGPSST